MPKPSYRPKKKSASTYKDYDSGNRRESDTGTTKRATQNKIRAQTKAFVDSAQSRTRQTDTGHSKRKAKAKQNRINKQFDPSTGAKRERMTDAHTGHSPRYLYGTEPTKKQMEKKYGTREQNSLTTYDKVNYRGKQMEDKIKRKWKPSNTSSKRPDENGREWENHKYIDKVKTKSGKIRYVYEIEGGGSKQTNTGDLKKKANSQKNLLASSRKASSRNTGRSKSSGGGSFRSKAAAWLKGLFG